MPPNATLEIDLALLGWKKVEKVTGEWRLCQASAPHAVVTQGCGMCACMVFACSLCTRAACVCRRAAPACGRPRPYCGGLAAQAPGEQYAHCPAGLLLHAALGVCTRAGLVWLHNCAACFRLRPRAAADGLVMKKTLVDTEEWKKPNAGAGACCNQRRACARCRHTLQEHFAPGQLAGRQCHLVAVSCPGPTCGLRPRCPRCPRPAC